MENHEKNIENLLKITKKHKKSIENHKKLRDSDNHIDLNSELLLKMKSATYNLNLKHTLVAIHKKSYNIEAGRNDTTVLNYKS